MNSRFSALLLAGGKSRRMGADKALLEVDGEALWQRQLRTLRSLQPRELFIAGQLEAENCITICDAQPESGPLAGVVAGLRRSSALLLVVLAIDLPRLTSDYLRKLIAFSSSGIGVVPHEQPLAAVYPVNALPVGEECLAQGEYSMHNFVARCAAQRLVRQKSVAPADEHLFVNLNTPADLASF